MKIHTNRLEYIVHKGSSRIFDLALCSPTAPPRTWGFPISNRIFGTFQSNGYRVVISRWNWMGFDMQNLKVIPYPLYDIHFALYLIVSMLGDPSPPTGLSVCLFVCLCTGYLKKLWPDPDEILWTGWVCDKDELIRFW